MRIVLLLLCVVSSFCLFAQAGYKIDFTIKGLKDTTAYLAYYYQENTYIRDTAQVNGKGTFTFTDSKNLTQGLYFIVLNKINILNFVVGHNQHFTIETSTEDYIKKMVVRGDEDNRLFVESMNFNMERNKEAEPFSRTINDSTLNDEQKKSAREGLNKINEKVKAYQQSIIEKYPKTLTARLMKMNWPVQIPDAPKKANGSVDSTFQFRYYRQHYFDNFDLADPAMLRLPKVVYWEKVKEYLDRLFVQDPDTITKAMNELIAIAKKNEETYRYLVWKCIVNYQTPEIMGLDKVYINLFDKYFATGEMDALVDKKTKQNMKDYADKLRRALIGTTAPNMIMQDENFQPRSMYDLKNKYTILWFFKPSCGHCREKTPKLVEFYKANKSRFDLAVFAVSTDTAMQELRDFIKEMKTEWITVCGPRTYQKQHFSEQYYAELTPTAYILDNKKKIIARRLEPEQMEGFLLNYEKMLRKKGTP